MKKVAVLILNYKVCRETLSCVTSVQESDYLNLKIIVIDNNSQDEIGREIKKFKDVKFIQNDENFGFSGGNNIGIKQAIKNEAEYIFILNPDTIITKDTIKLLVTAAEKNNAGIAGPKILFADKKTIWYAGGILDLNNVLGSHRGVNEIDHGQYDKEGETDYVSGAAMMVKKEVFEKIGLLDKDYFLYYEDNDFCFRAKQAGLKIMYTPQAVVYHRNAQSTGLGSSLQDYYITRNRMLFASKFLPLRTRFALFREGVRNLNQPIRRKAFFDFLIGNFSKGNF